MGIPGQNQYLLSALPSPGELGQTPPITAVALLEHVSPFAGPHAILQAILLSDDLLQRQAVLAGETQEPSPAVLTAEQLTDEAPLPAYLTTEADDDTQRPAGEDLLWETYFRYVAEVARSSRNSFLAQWVAFEVGLRNAIAALRARALELDVHSYLVAQDLADDHDDFSSILNEWSAAATPLAGLRVLDEARWQWLNENDAWFSFKDDELAAYAVRVMLLTRWHRLAEQEHTRSNQATPSQA